VTKKIIFLGCWLVFWTGLGWLIGESLINFGLSLFGFHFTPSRWTGTLAGLGTGIKLYLSGFGLKFIAPLAVRKALRRVII